MRCANCGRELVSEDEACPCGGLLLADSLQAPVPTGATSPDLSPEERPATRKGRRVLALVLAAAVLAGAIGYGVYALVNHFQTPAPGIYITLQAQDTARARVASERLQQCADVIQRRLDKLGVSSVKVTVKGSDQIVVGLPVGSNVDAIAPILTQAGDLEFYGTADFGRQYSSAEEALAAAGVTSREQLPAGTSLVEWPAETDTDVTLDAYYLVTPPPAVSGYMLKSAGFDSDTSNGSYRVTMDFTAQGATAFANVTKRLAQIGETTGVTQRLAIVLDGVVESAPTVREEIDGGKAEITGRFTQQEAKDLAAVLQTGALSLELVRVQ